MRRYRLLLLGVAAYLLFLLVLFPASAAYSLLGPSAAVSQLQLEGIGGSLWAGRVNSIVWNGRNIGSLSWDLKLLSLLGGNLRSDFSLQTANGYLQGEVAVPFSADKARFESLSGQLPLAELQALLPYSLVTVDGSASLAFKELVLDAAGRPIEANGRINWQHAAVLAPQAFSMGDLQADITTDEKGVLAAKLKDMGGPLQLDAQLQLRPDHNYSLSGTVAAAKDAEASLSQALSWLGKAGAGGKYRLNLSGRL